MAGKKYLLGLRALRRDRSLSQATLALRLGVSQTNISRYENQLRFPRLKLMKAFCEVLGCELWELCHPDPIRLRQTIALGEAVERGVA
jgi:transcriptional regulator with XRE-family HTH domain